VEIPIGNAEPDGGVQTTVTGATPPETVGAGNMTVAVRAVVRVDWFAGHDTLGPSIGVGFMGLSPHAVENRAASRVLAASQEL
jgi:hypothetical protein